MQEEKKKKKKKLPTKWKLIIGISFCGVLLLATWLLGQRFEAVRSTLNTVAEPIQKGYLAAESWVMDILQDMQTKKNLEDENVRLKEELERVQNENLRLQSDARRVQELEELYALDTYYKDYPKTGAQIVGLSPNNWYESFIIDKGSEDGIEKYMPILADNGLAGHVSEVYGHYAKIVSVVNKDSYIYGQINRKGGDLVAVQGARGYSSPDTGAVDEDLCMIQFVTNDIDITIGDEIVTSSLGDIYPPGLRIGTVIEIKPLGTGYESLAYVKPVVNLDQLDTVLVITEIWKQDMHKEIAGDGNS
ncbi:MAG: rod shape-determining protein MreC [Lachnospiraceae bacterium]|jgi:rod shape-determining protein MreC|nr:rod shape-determining protein MreC [Lachnospiraceae bacterium]